MPVLDGYEATRQIMERTPTPIVMATASSSQAETRNGFTALEAGALILLAKPPALWDEGHEEPPRAAAHAQADGRGQGRPPLRATRTAQHPSERFTRPREPRLVAIGAWTGGPQALAAILDGLPGRWAAGAAGPAHHRGFVDGFVEWLGTHTSMAVVVARTASSCGRGRCTSPAADVT